MKKIINVYNGYLEGSGQGGGVRYLQDLIQEQKKRGFDVIILGSGKGGSSKKHINGVEVEYIPIADTLNWLVFLFALLFHILLHRNQYSESIFHIHRAYFSPVLCLAKRAKVVVTIHTKTFAVFEAKYPKLKSIVNVFIKIERFIINNFVDEISFSGNSAKELYINRGVGLSRSMIDLPGRSLMKMTTTKTKNSLFKNDGKKRLLCVGRISAVKRPVSVANLFWQAINIRPDVADKYRLYFVGDGEQVDELRDFINEKGLSDKIVLLGAVPSVDMTSVYHSSEGLILLSESETGPYVVKEALLAGKPVFATDVGIISDCVTEKSGYIIPVQNPEQRVDELLSFMNEEYKAHDCVADISRLLLQEEKAFQQGIEKLYN